MTQANYWIAAGCAFALAIVAGLADWLRVHRRRSIDDIGWMPWRTLQVAAFFATLAFAIVAFRN
jgi:hypothetical protein